MRELSSPTRRLTARGRYSTTVRYRNVRQEARQQMIRIETAAKRTGSTAGGEEPGDIGPPRATGDSPSPLVLPEARTRFGVWKSKKEFRDRGPDCCTRDL